MFQGVMKQGLDLAKEDDERRMPVDLAVAAGNEGFLALFKKEV